MSPYLYSFDFSKNNCTLGFKANNFVWSRSSIDNAPINCWNFNNNECGIIMGNGIDWKNQTINSKEIYFLDLSPLSPNARKIQEKLKDFLRALKDPASNQLRLSFKVI